MADTVESEQMTPIQKQAGLTHLNDERDLVARARQHDKAAVRTIIRQNNQRLFRVARSILKDEWEAEDAVQEAYVRAFTHLAEFEEKSSLNTWLTRIVVNESLGRLRRRPRLARARGPAGHRADWCPA